MKGEKEKNDEMNVSSVLFGLYKVKDDLKIEENFADKVMSDISEDADCRARDVLMDRIKYRLKIIPEMDADVKLFYIYYKADVRELIELIEKTT